MFFVELIKILAWVLLSIIELAMLIRAIMSWFVMGDNPFVNILNTITEPFIFPFRHLSPADRRRSMCLPPEIGIRMRTEEPSR